MPSRTSLHISLNVCHVTSHHPTPPMPSHTSLHISLNVCHVTSHHPPPHPCIPTHPYTYAPVFVMLLHTTHPPHPCLSMHPYTYPPMFVMLLHTTHPTHAFPRIPTHIPQCLSFYFTPPTNLTPPRPMHPTPHHQPTHPYSTLHLNIFKVWGWV